MEIQREECQSTSPLPFGVCEVCMAPGPSVSDPPPGLAKVSTLIRAGQAGAPSLVP